MATTPRDKSRQEGFAGTLRNIQLTDIIQMCCLAGASMMIRVSQGQQQGTIHIVNGEVLHAECGSLVGEDAFFGILQWEGGSFETLDAQPIENPSIQKNCQFLLMEAARLIDEQQAGQTEEEGEAAEDFEEPGPERLRVMIVDDSAIMCKILSSMLRADPGIEVAGIAKNGEQALELLQRLSPDLIALDVNMPVMDGSTALKHIMIQSPCPVLIMSNLVQSAYGTILNFLNLGAVDFASKPVNDKNILLQQQKIVQRIHLAAAADVRRFRRFRPAKIPPDLKLDPADTDPAGDLVLVLSGTGGYLEAVRLLTSMKGDLQAAVVATVSAPPLFLPTLVEYLNPRCRFQVSELTDQQRLVRHNCYLTPVGASLAIECDSGQEPFVHKSDTPAGNDYLLLSGDDYLLPSAARCFGKRLSVVLLSGAVYDGAELAEVIEGGGQIITPPAKECIIARSIEKAIKAGWVQETVKIDKMADWLAKRHAAGTWGG